MKELHNGNSRLYMFQSKMKLTLPVSFCLVYLSSCCVAEVNNCSDTIKPSGVIDYSFGHYADEKCWIIVVPEDSYMRLDLVLMKFVNWRCSDAFVKFSVIGGNEEYKYCSTDLERKPIIVLNDVKVTLVHGVNPDVEYTGFVLNYTAESIICAKNDHFRCSKHHCIHQHQVCDGEKDCENGVDEASCENEVTTIAGVNTSRENAVTWLKNQLTDSYAWGANTYRAIIALYLSEGERFREEAVDDNLLTKQLDRQIAIELTRNSDDPTSVNELSMFINALSVMCREPRNFYGYDLLEFLSKSLLTLSSPSPGAFLTLCTANRTFSDSQIRRLLNILSTHSGYLFNLDIQAMSLMVLTCIKNKTNNFYNIENSTKIYNAAINNFISHQQQDGSFGNVYTTAVVTQALLSSGREHTRKWDLESTIQYLMRHLNSSSIDFLSVYFVAPIFNGKSLVDVEDISCEEQRKKGEDDEILDILNKLAAKIEVKYFLYIGEKKDVIYSIGLKTSKNSSAYDVMRLAQVVDHKYKFLQTVTSGTVYVYEIAGMTNDPETGRFWLTYFRNSSVNGTLQQYTQSPDKLFLNDGDQLVLWYKTVHI